MADSLAQQPFIPKALSTLEQAGLGQTFLEDLICKILLSYGSLTGRELADIIGLPLAIFSVASPKVLVKGILAFA